MSEEIALFIDFDNIRFSMLIGHVNQKRLREV